MLSHRRREVLVDEPLDDGLFGPAKRLAARRFGDTAFLGEFRQRTIPGRLVVALLDGREEQLALPLREELIRVGLIADRFDLEGVAERLELLAELREPFARRPNLKVRDAVLDDDRQFDGEACADNTRSGAAVSIWTTTRSSACWIGSMSVSWSWSTIDRTTDSISSVSISTSANPVPSSAVAASTRNVTSGCSDETSRIQVPSGSVTSSLASGISGTAYQYRKTIRRNPSR